MESKVKVKVCRFNPAKDKKPGYSTYEVSLEGSMSVLNVLDYIFENLDSTLSFYGSCRRGECNRCNVNVNGKTVRACLEIVKGDIIVDPVPKYEIIKDLYVDMEKTS